MNTAKVVGQLIDGRPNSLAKRSTVKVMRPKLSRTVADLSFSTMAERFDPS